MVKLVKHDKLYGKSINFIDTNGVYLGYDDPETDTACCESLGWFISDSPDTPLDWNNHPTDYEDLYDVSELDGYTFVPPALIPDAVTTVYGGEIEDGEQISFMLAHPDKPYKYLHLYNAHNGYYGHNAIFVINDQLTDYDL